MKRKRVISEERINSKFNLNGLVTNPWNITGTLIILLYELFKGRQPIALYY